MTTPATPSQDQLDNSRQRRFLLLIIGLFILPLLAAWLLLGVWQPGGTQHGELLSPAQPIPTWQGQEANGSPISMERLRGRWLMAYLSGAEQCQDACQKTLYHMRQMQQALGRDAERVQTVLWFTQPPQSALLDWLVQDHQDMRKIILADPAVADFIAAAFATGAIDKGIYLIDPLGNLFMHYTPAVNPKDILEDLKRLLKYSTIG